MRVLRVPPTGPGRSGQVRHGPPRPARALRASASPSTCWWCAARACSACPGSLAGRWLGKPVVLQAEINGELSGEVYYWGTRFARRPRGAASSAAATRFRNLLCATPRPSWPCRSAHSRRDRGGRGGPPTA